MKGDSHDIHKQEKLMNNCEISIQIDKDGKLTAEITNLASKSYTKVECSDIEQSIKSLILIKNYILNILNQIKTSSV